jgi:hypothetical protein
LGLRSGSLLVHTQGSQQRQEEDHDRRQSYRPRHHRPGPRLLDDPRSWEKWVEHYEGKGYRVLTSTYPGFEGGVEALREDPSPIEALTLPAVVEHIGAS